MRNLLQKYSIIIVFVFVIISLNTYGGLNDPPTILQYLNNPAPGYIFCTPYQTGYVNLLDNSNYPVYYKTINSRFLFSGFNLQPNGQLTFYSVDKFFILDTSYAIVDSVKCIGNYITDFHDIKLLPNKHIIIFGVDKRKIDMSKLVANGKVDADVYGFDIQELDSAKNIVFEWNTFDHLNITDATEDIDLTQPSISYAHLNYVEVDYDGNWLLSFRYLDEIIKIDRTTGDIIWRLGGTKSKNNQFTFINDDQNGFFGFSHQHSPIRLSNGNILMLDNGNLKSPQISRAVEYQINEQNKTATKVWEFKNFPSIFSSSQGSVQRFANGNTLIGWGENNSNYTCTEVHPDGTRAFVLMGYSSLNTFRYIFKMRAVMKNISDDITYDFNEPNNSTAVSLSLLMHVGNGNITVEKHDYLPHNLQFVDSVPYEVFPKRWLINTVGLTRIQTYIRFNVDSINGLTKPDDCMIYYRVNEGSGSFTRLNTTYNPQTKELQVVTLNFGEYIIGKKLSLDAPNLKNPANDTSCQPTHGFLYWDSIPGVDLYHLQLSKNSNFSSLIIDINNITTPSQSYTGLDYNTKYYWRVNATNTKLGLTSKWSPISNFSTLHDKPQLAYPPNDTVGISIDGVMSWLAIPDADSYHIQVSDTVSFDRIIVDKADIKALNYSYSGYSFNKKYYWRVFGINTECPSLWSDSWSFTTVLDVPRLKFPPNKSISVNVAGNLSWYPLDGAETYKLQLSTSDKFDNNILDLTGIANTTINFDTIDYEKNFYWHVSAESHNNFSYDWSETWRFTTEKKPADAINDTYEKNISIEYNSKYGKILISNINVNKENSRIIVYDIYGNNVLSYSLNTSNQKDNIAIEAGNLATGVYFVNVINSNKSIIKSILKY